MTNSIINPLGSITNYRDPYDSATTYYYKNWVSMFGCVFEARGDNFSGIPPLKEEVDGTITFVNREYWKCIIDNVALHNKVLATNSLESQIKKMVVDNVARDKDIANLQAKLEELIISSKGDGYYTIFKLNGTPVDTLSYDTVNSMEQAYASFEADFYYKKSAFSAAKATLNCLDESGTVLGSTEISNGSSIVVSGSGLYLSKGCKTIQAVVQDTAGNVVMTSTIGVVQGVAGIVSLTIYLLSGGYVWRTGQGKVATIGAAVIKGDYDITDAQDSSQFIWTRESADSVGDTNWNNAHTTGSKTLSVDESDMSGNSTNFICTLYNGNGEAVEAKKLNFHL